MRYRNIQRMRLELRNYLLPNQQIGCFMNGLDHHSEYNIDRLTLPPRVSDLDCLDRNQRSTMDTHTEEKRTLYA